MDRGFLRVLLLIMSINALSLQHFFKLPVLVAHFFEHQQRGPSITVMGFLSMHYWGEDINDDDQDRDMQLPFKKVEFSHSGTILFFQGGHQLAFNIEAVDTSYPITDNENHTSQYLESLFKPPRFS